MTEHRRSALALAGVLAFGLATGLAGIRWGLPGPDRLRAFPPQLVPTPEIARLFADRWAKLYEDVRRSHAELRSEEPVTYVQGVDEIPAGWKLPPDKLLNSYRSLLLQSENPDEKKAFIILSQMRPWKLEFKPLYVVYGGAFIYPLGAFLKLLSILGALTLVPDMGHYLQNPGDMGRLYLGGRLFILLFQLGSLWMLYDAGRRLRGPLAGALAALFFALCPLVVANSHILKPHPYAAFWALAALRSGLMAFESGRARDYGLCGLFGGMALGSNFTLASFAAMPALVWVGRARAAGSRGELKAAAGGCLLAAAIFVASNPYFIFAHRDYAWEMGYAGGGSVTLAIFGTVFARLAGHGMGPALAALCALELFAALRGRQRAPRALAWGFLASLAVLLLLLSFRAGFMTFQHYYYPIVGWACLLAGAFVARLSPRARALAAAAVLATSGAASWAVLSSMRRGEGLESTRHRAGAWIEARVPAGSRIGLARYPEPAHTPYFRYDRYHLVIFERPQMLNAKRLPDYIVVGKVGRDDGGLAAYELAEAFEPAFVSSKDENFFADAPIYVYRRRRPAP